MKKQGYNIDMCSGPLASKILLFALPLMASSLLQLLFNAADVVVVGRFAGKEALAAVGSNGSLINLLVNLFIGLSVGANVVIARDLGAGRYDRIGKSVHTTITLALCGGLFLAVFGFFAARWLLTLMKSPADVIDLSTLYLQIYFLGMPANLTYNFGAAILRARGDTRRPLYYLTIAGIVNVVLNLVFVIYFHMSVAGVALATIISQYISAVFVLISLMREEEPLRLDLRKLGVDWVVVKRILKVGLPAGFQSILFAISNVVIQSSVNSFNDAALVAGASTAGNIEGFVYVSMNAFYQAALTFTGQNYGAGECKRIDRTLLWCQLYTIIFGLAAGLFAAIFGEQLAAIYAPGEPEVIAWTAMRLVIVSAPYFICGVMEVFVGVLRGIGFSIVPMIVSLMGACGLRLIWIATIFQVYHTPEMLYLSYPVSWLVTALMHGGFFLLVRKYAYSQAGSSKRMAEATEKS